MTPAREPVLVLDGETNQALACVRSLGRAGHPVLVASLRRRSLAAWSRYCLASVWISEETPAGFARLRAWAIGRGVRIVLPLTERACILCNLERAAWEEAGITLGCAPQEMLQQAFDKVRSLEVARSCGVETPPTLLPDSLTAARAAAGELGFPCVVKARFSNAWDGTTFLPDLGPGYAANMSELESAVADRRQDSSWPIIQGFVPGQGKGVFALCDHGHAVAWFAHERLRDVRPSGSGSSLRRSAPLEPRLREPAERLLTALRWHGPAMVEFRDDGTHAPYLMEVNGRFWGSLQLAIAAGADFPRWWTAILSGRPLEPRRSYATGVTVRWLWGDVKRFLYILAGAPAGYPGRYPTIAQGLRELFGRQPPGTQSEAWQPGDRWPAVGEWVQGAAELMRQFWKTRHAPRGVRQRAQQGSTTGSRGIRSAATPAAPADPPPVPLGRG
jgi:predicted ATP-grasp superfamily ATP-dependent carboligase